MRSLRDTIHRLMELLEGSATSAEDDERELGLLLDELAMAAHGERPAPTDSDVEAPRRESEELHDLVATRFPSLGLYRAATLELEEELFVGDAVDDLADICRDLASVQWLWQNAGEAAAREFFYWSFEYHWAAHLRGLQWYLHEVMGERSEGG